MLTKIIYKNFRSNLKNYILFFLSNIVAIMELFVFYGIRSLLHTSDTSSVLCSIYFKSSINSGDTSSKLHSIN